MSCQIVLKCMLFASAWIYLAFSAPVESDEPAIMEDSKVQSCLKEGLPESLKEAYEICVSQDPSVEMVNDNEVLKCVLKTQEVILGEEENVDTSKLKFPEEAAAEVAEQEAATMPELNLFSVAIQNCEEKEEVKSGKASDLVECLLENLIMNCTLNMKEMEMVPMAMEESESKEVNMMAPMTMEEDETANETL